MRVTYFVLLLKQTLNQQEFAGRNDYVCDACLIFHRNEEETLLQCLREAKPAGHQDLIVDLTVSPAKMKMGEPLTSTVESVTFSRRPALDLTPCPTRSEAWMNRLTYSRKRHKVRLIPLFSDREARPNRSRHEDYCLQGDRFRPTSPPHYCSSNPHEIPTIIFAKLVAKRAPLCH